MRDRDEGENEGNFPRKIQLMRFIAQKTWIKTVNTVQKSAFVKKAIDNAYENYYTALVSKPVY